MIGVSCLCVATARAQYHDNCWLRQDSGYGTNFYGVNPSTAALQSELRTWASYYQVPLEVAAAVCYQESVGAFQFDADGYPGPFHSGSGFVVHNIAECQKAHLTGYINSGGTLIPPPGLGLMQLTSQTAINLSSAEGRGVGDLISDWHWNVKAGIKLLAQKYEDAIVGDPGWLAGMRRETANRGLLENWYYAIAFYHGSADTNGITDGYINAVYGYIASPPSKIAGMFNPVSVSKPSSVIGSNWHYNLGFVATPSGIWYDTQDRQYSGAVHASTAYTQSPTIVDISPHSIGIAPGDTFPITCTISASSSRNVILGASLYPAGQTAGRIDDKPHDLTVSLVAGQNSEQRQFMVSSGISPGTYDLEVALWDDLNNNGVIDAGDNEITRYKIQNAVTVSQNGSCTYSLNPTRLDLSSGGGAAGKFDISTASTCRWTASPDANWISLTGYITASGSASVTFNVDANPNNSPRTGTISVQDQTFTITQPAVTSQTVTVSSLFVAPPSARQGQTPTFYANVTSPISQSVLLGGSIVLSGTNSLYNDPTNDKAVTLVSGTGQYSRQFTLPTNLPVGTYDVIFGVWSDTNGNGHIDPTIDSLLGSFTAYGSLTVQPAIGSVHTILTPAEAVNAGALWSVDGSSWIYTGSIYGGLAVGNHTISFKPIAGWSTPSDQIVPVSGGQTTEVAGVYVQIPIVTSVNFSRANGFTINWTGNPAYTYSVLRSSDLSFANPTVLTSGHPGSSPTFTDTTVPANATSMFYKVSVDP